MSKRCYSNMCVVLFGLSWMAIVRLLKRHNAIKSVSCLILTTLTICTMLASMIATSHDHEVNNEDSTKSRNGFISTSMIALSLVCISCLFFSYMKHSNSRQSRTQHIKRKSIFVSIFARNKNSRKRNKSISKSKDGYHFVHIAIFSTIFGCATSWFLVFQLIENIGMIQRFVLVISVMIMSVLYTMAAILGYSRNEKDFSEAIQMSKYGMVVSLVSILNAGLFHISSETTTSLLVLGGYLSTFLSIWGLHSLLLTVAIRSRERKSLNTRATANFYCLLTWLVWTSAIFGGFGLASIDVSSSFRYILGIPASIPCTLMVAPILLLLEGDPKNRYTNSAISTRNLSYLGVTLPLFSRHTRTLIPMLAASFIFIIASFYAILFRGSVNWLFTHSVHKSYDDMFQSMYGSDARVTFIKNHSEIAGLLQKQINHKNSIAVSSKLAASGFWTSMHRSGPTMHLLGLILSFSTWYTTSSLLTTIKPSSARTSFWSSLPLNIFPLLFCRGIPSLTAAAYLGIIVTSYQHYALKRLEWAGKMKI